MKPRNRPHKFQLLLAIEPPKEIEDHRDFLLKESRWMYGCFTEEHKWKTKSFKSIAHSAVKYIQTKEQRLKKRKEEEERRLKLVSKNISVTINKFWGNISKIVRHKKISELNKILRIKQFEKLDKLVSETEKFYFGSVSDSGTIRDKVPEFSNKNEVGTESDRDIDMDPENWEQMEEMDNKLDLEMESSNFDSDDMNAELDELNNDADLNLEELYLKYYGNPVDRNTDTRGNPDIITIDSGEEVGTKNGSEDSDEFIPDICDQEEIDAEKEMSDADRDDILDWEECNSLNDANIPVNELIMKLKHGNKSPSSVDIKKNCEESISNSKIKIPFLLKLKMREYQVAGLEWMVNLYKKGLNGILADEMGLGKTIQTISLLAYLACYMENWGPHLIVVPTSVMLNWEMEFKRWLPSFKVITYFGNPKERQKKRIGWSDPNAFNVCIASYTLILQDAHIFKRKQWQYLILDEAQNIKNFKSQKWQVMLSFNTERRLLLTGTPLQNNLMELWSLLHFLMPHIFTSHHDFKTWFSDPLTTAIENQQIEGERNLLARLHSVLRPFLLRRLKKDVEKEMPSKIEHVIKCPLSKRQKELYDEFLESKSTQNTIAGGDYIGLMNILMQLRKVCNHPDLFEPRLIKTPIFEEKLMIRPSFNSLIFFPNICTTMQSDVPSLGKYISTNNYLFVGKIRTSFISKFDKLTNNRFINLPNVFILYNEIHMNRIQTQSQYELSYNKWSKMKFNGNNPRISSLGTNFVESGDLIDVHRFIRLGLNEIASTRLDGSIIGLESHRTENIKNEDQHKTDNVFNKVKSLSSNITNCEDRSSLFPRTDQKVTNEWMPSCNYPHLLDESIQVFHGSKKLVSDRGDIYLRLVKPFKVVYGKDCRNFIVDELNNKVGTDGEHTLTISTFPTFFSRKRKINNDLAFSFKRPSNSNILTENKNNKLSPKTIFGKLLFTKPYYYNQLPTLTQFNILLGNIIESSNQSISIEGKYSYIKNELFCSSYISPKVVDYINASSTYLYDISSLKKCIVPPKRIIEDDCGKLQVLSKLLYKLYIEGHRCIIFTQMSKMLDVLEAFINYRGYNYLRLDGSTKVEDRQKLVNRFNRDQRIYLFISSTRSGGVGLNLTGADTVIFYDSDWNPAMDRQAMDRCHRIGQTRDVNIYRLISEWTIEESIFKKQLQKRLLDDVVVDQGHFTSEFFTKGDIQKMVGSRSQNMLNSENDSIYVTRVLHGSSSDLNTFSHMEDQQRKEFEDVLVEVEDLDDINALKRSSKEIAAENDSFISEFGEEKATFKYEVNNVSEKTLNRQASDDTNQNVTQNSLLNYCIEFFENISIPTDIQNEVDLMMLQIKSIDDDVSDDNSSSGESQSE
ncbi:Swr1p like SWI/SNF2 ATPase [Cryptosporidium canis]|uniref:Swr1p like SWI/SNF2 ATPase n=1 Tax=Cryptosporidium canis TaxID=195482 RepID=A0A9D5DIG7_9CRYT|nr:Swr1p like SWI/SNF2 ATPase [Cryptosporidium canis]